MCGRYVSVQGDADLLAEFDAVYTGGDNADARSEQNYNVAPTDGVRAVVNRKLRHADGRATGEAVRQLRVMRWGLVPSWSKDRSSDDQCAGRIGAVQAGVPKGLRRPSLPDPG
jgi:putative SOS response-associated peptidase YedK